MNKAEYQYIVDNKLNTKQGQNGKKINLPFGALEIKAAWKILGKGDNVARYYAQPAWVTNDADGEGKQKVIVGLAGLHIAYKTESSPQWIWATFEHVDTMHGFNNPNCGGCPPNQQTAKQPYKECTFEGDKCVPVNGPVQVQRVLPITQDVEQVNEQFQKLLRKLNQNSVWANYQLVNVQWPSAPGKPGGVPVPSFLANVLIETFDQGPKEPTDGDVPYPAPGYKPFKDGVSASCMKCHSVATGANHKPADFSFLFLKAAH